MHGPLRVYTRRWRRVDGASRRLKRVARGSTGGRYNQKGGCTVVVRVVRAGRGGAAPSAVVCCTVGFRLSAPRNALRDSLRSSFTFGQTWPQVKRTRAASPKAIAMESARRRRRCKGWGCCPFVAADMGPHAASAPCSKEVCRTRSRTQNEDLQLVCLGTLGRSWLLRRDAVRDAGSFTQAEYSDRQLLYQRCAHAAEQL